MTPRTGPSFLTRSFGLDLALLLVTMFLPWDPVQDMFAKHRVPLYYALGASHVLYIPLVMVQVMFGRTQAGDALFAGEVTSRSKVMAWVVTLFMITSFIVPFVTGLAIHRDAPVGTALAILLGPYALLGFAVFGVLRMEKRLGYHATLALFAGRGLEFATLAGTWAYLTMIESTLLLAAGTGGIWSRGLCLAAALVSYLPVRVFVFTLQASKPHESWLLGIAFAHFLVRLLVAAPAYIP